MNVRFIKCFRKDLYLWASNIARGPSAKFQVENVHTMAELKMTGNCLKASRPILSFDKSFESEPHLAVVRELFTQVFELFCVTTNSVECWFCL